MEKLITTVKKNKRKKKGNKRVKFEGKEKKN